MKLNLRDFFWLIFVAAVATMWWLDRTKLADRLRFYETPPPPVAAKAATPATIIWMPPAPPRSYPAEAAPPELGTRVVNQEVKVFGDQPYSPPGARILDEPVIGFPDVK
jgi:hypothetical protein